MTIIKDISKAKEILQKDGLIAIPTETVYGLAGNAYNEIAIKKIFELKKRPFHNPLIIHLKSTLSIYDVAKEIPETALLLAEKFWPGPLTLLLKKKDHISDLITAGKNTVAVRVPNHPFALILLNQLDFPLVAPSANPFGSISPTSAEHVFHYFGLEIDLILDGGKCEKGVESTIIGFENNTPILYRHGSISIEEIEKITGKLSIITNNDTSPSSPGMLARHYAPKTDTYLTNDVSALLNNYKGKKVGLLLFKKSIHNNNIANTTEIIHQEILSKSGDYSEAAKNLYAAMHRLDQNNLDLIIAERLPDEGLGKTINDKLERATKK
jgi:L-threonylcarbamoyladenylate synthase